MKTLSKYALLSVALASALVATAAVSSSGAAAPETFHVVITKAIGTGAYKVGQDYGESKVLTGILNDLAKQGYGHVSMHPVYEEYRDVREVRFLIVSRR